MYLNYFCMDLFLLVNDVVFKLKQKLVEVNICLNFLNSQTRTGHPGAL